MDYREAGQRCRTILSQYGLAEKGWRFTFDSSVRRFGLCSHTNKMISLSRTLTEQNTWEEVRATMMHEIAHALVGPGHGHNEVWKAKCRELGISDSRCYDAANNGRNVEKAPFRYTAPCCGKLHGRYRAPRRNYTYYCTTCGQRLEWA